MLRIHDIKIPALTAEERRKQLENKLRSFFGGRLPEYRIARRSLDARKKPEICYVYTLDVFTESEETALTRITRRSRLRAELLEPAVYRLPLPGTETLRARPVIVGAGPCGLFAAYTLARAGYRPLILEQGAAVEERQRDVEAFWAGAPLKPWSNVQFGEGGAGTFSDGKLNTGIKDPSGRIQEVLKVFADCGADPAVCYDAKPHIGTDVLARVVVNLRQRIEALGGCFCFHTRLKGLECPENRLKALWLENTVSGEESRLEAELLILAPGHSARETFPMLQRTGVRLEPKGFAVGLRIQHPQSLIDRIQYGRERDETLPAADYKLTAKTAAGRGVYSFCMCPGGQVVNASSEDGRLCVNGMSRSARDGRNANSALIVQVGPDDFDAAEGVFAGMEFQRRLEQAAYACAGGKIPLQLWEDFRNGLPSGALGGIEPDCGGAWAFGDLRKCLPPFIAEALLEAMPQFDRKLPGFDCPDAVLAGVEARTSSPLTILRDENCESTVRGIYPAGEGAGYAGGITSAAVDGIKAAEKIISRYAAPRV